MTVVVDSSVLAESLVDARSEGEWAEAALAADARAAPELAGEISRLEATSAHRDLLRLDLELFILHAIRRARVGVAAQPDRL